MSSHHDEHHSEEKKPVSFTVPFILASVTLLAVVLFLSLCDPKPHHEGGHEGHEATEAAHHEADHHEAVTEDHHEAAKVEASDSMTVESTVPAAEAPAEHAH